MTKRNIGIAVIVTLIVIMGINYKLKSNLGGSQTVYGQPAVYNATTQTLDNGQGAALEVDVNGNLKTTESNSYYATTTPSLGAIKKSAGFLNCVTMTKTTVATTTFYDSLTKTGTVILQVSPGVYGSLCVNANFSTGLFASSTSDTIDTYTVSYK